MCKYPLDTVICSAKLSYCLDCASKLLIRPELSGNFFRYHPNKLQVMYFGKLDENLDVVFSNKPLWFVSVGGVTTLPFLLELLLERVGIWWILPLGYQTWWSCVALVSLFSVFCWFYAFVFLDSWFVPSFSDSNASLGVDGSGKKEWKIDGVVKNAKKLNSAQYLNLGETSYSVLSFVLALRGMLCKISMNGRVKYVVTCRCVLEVPLPPVLYK
ncbi:hypothetical protein ACHQM5_021791 [Ranunculus cassubicifolius]